MRNFTTLNRLYENHQERLRSEREEKVNLCSGPRNDSHKEVAYEGDSCPVCEVSGELREELALLRGEIKQLESQVAQLEAATK
jgi:uncharacterized protein YciI